MKPNIKTQQTVEIYKQGSGIQGMYEHIERCGRNCYRSDVKGGESAVKFVEGLEKSGHGAMLEHGSVYLVYGGSQTPRDAAVMGRIISSPYTKYFYFEGKAYITTNYRVIVENEAKDVMEKYWSDCTIHHPTRITVFFDTNIGISREFNRHRVNSIAESSTRYCNYTKDKFGGSISVLLPTWLRKERYRIEGYDFEVQPLDRLFWWTVAMEGCCQAYVELIKLGCKPQEAREVLPLATSTQLIHTAFLHDWKHFYELRGKNTPSNHPHPLALEAATLMEKVFRDNGIVLNS